MVGDEYGRRRAELRAEAMTAKGRYQTNSLQILKGWTKDRHDEERQHEQAVERDIAKRRREVRASEARRFHHLFPAPPRKSDMTYWKTRIGEPEKIQTPEEDKGKREKSLKYHKFEVNTFRSHALEGFIYWVRRDETLLLSKPISHVYRNDRLHLKSCNSLGSMRPHWKSVQL